MSKTALALLLVLAAARAFAAEPCTSRTAQAHVAKHCGTALNPD